MAESKKVKTNGNGSDNVREVMKTYWSEHSKVGSVEEMMLDNDAKKIEPMEKKEILGMLPFFQGKHIIELASGVGRFTSTMAKDAASIICVEFMENFHNINVKTNAHHGNIEFLCQDVNFLDRPDESADLIFSNWLLMYLEDSECERLAMNCLRWLAPGGHMFFRESCFRQSGNAKRSFNPTKYRHPDWYMDCFRTVRIANDDGSVDQFELVMSRCVDTYVQYKQNQGQICWLFVKVRYPSSANVDQHLKRFLDHRQYTRNNIKAYEWIHNSRYTSVGGKSTFEQHLLPPLKRKDTLGRVLDLGSGTGTTTFALADNLRCPVHGLELSSNMANIAFERAVEEKIGPLVSFEIADVTRKNFPMASFDCAVSSEMLVQAKNKNVLLRKLFSWLQHGGIFSFTDYVRLPTTGSDDVENEFKQFTSQYKFNFITAEEYSQLLKIAGFVDVKIEQLGKQLQSFTTAELEKLKNGKTEFVGQFGEDTFTYCVEFWEQRLKFARAGLLGWISVVAYKPNIASLLN